MNESQEITPLGWFVLRTPLLSFDEWVEWSREIIEKGSLWESAFGRYLHEGGEPLPSLNGIVMEAIYLASPSLFKALEDWLKKPRNTTNTAVETKFFSYLSRMSCRPTPFGIFAGTSVGEVGAATNLKLCPRSNYERKTRLDLLFLHRVCNRLLAEFRLHPYILYRPNSMVHKSGNTLKYVERLRNTPLKDVFHYRPNACSATPYLETILKNAETGATLDELSNSAPPDVNSVEARAFIEELVDAQLLVPQVEPSYTGIDPSSEFVSQLSALPSCLNIARDLEKANDHLATIDKHGLGHEASHYKRIVEALSCYVGPTTDVADSRIFHADLLKPSANLQISQAIVDETVKGIRILKRFSPARNDTWREFKQAFSERFGDEEVPILEALDEETGIHFGYPADKQSEATTISWRSRDSELLRRIVTAVSDGKAQLELESAELESLAVPEPRILDDFFSVFAIVIANSGEAIDRGDFKLMITHYLPAASFYGRFCSVDPNLEQRVRQMLLFEEHSNRDVIYAELVHCPGETKPGNHFFRPKMTQFEIPICSMSTAPADNQISLKDLVVRHDGKRMVLKSRRLCKEIVPRLSNAHDFERPFNLSLYQFLAGLASQDNGTGALLNWGPVLSSLPFFPRITHGRLILNRACWTLRNEELPSDKSQVSLMDAIASLRAKKKIPRLVSLFSNAVEVIIDLENLLSVRLLVASAARQNRIVLSELLPGEDGLCVNSKEGRFFHELVIPFRCAGRHRTDSDGRKESHAPQNSASAASAKYRYPGDDWLYIKLYSNPLVLESALVDSVRSCMSTLQTMRIVDRWFFIRYQDPQFHLRLRLHGSPNELQDVAMPMFRDILAPLMNRENIWRVQIDTYERETERYLGIEGIELAERIFHVDSVSVVDALAFLGESINTTDRAWLTIAGINSLLADFGFDLQQRTSIVASFLKSVQAKMKSSEIHERHAGQIYRSSRKHIIQLLTNPKDISLEAFAVRSSKIRLYSNEVRECAARAGDVALISLIQSYVHMHVNRMLRSPDRGLEFMLYDFLHRTYCYFTARGMTNLVT